MHLNAGFKTHSDSTAVIWNTLDTAQFIWVTHLFGCLGSLWVSQLASLVHLLTSQLLARFCVTFLPCPSQSPTIKIKNI